MRATIDIMIEKPLTTSADISNGVVDAGIATAGESRARGSVCAAIARGSVSAMARRNAIVRRVRGLKTAIAPKAYRATRLHGRGLPRARSPSR